jgi:glycosyltransferase involved in cell wall biosynthesis
MKIGIDIRYLSRGVLGGIHTYLRCLIPEIIKQAPGHTFFLYADTKAPVELSLAPWPVNIHLRRRYYRNAASFVAGDIGMWRDFARDQVQVAHFPANYGIAAGQTRSIVTLHDALTLQPVSTYLRSSGSRKNLRGVFLTFYLHYLSLLAIRRADVVVTISEYARREILRYATIDANRIVVIPHGAPEDMRRIEDAITRSLARQKLRLPDRYILADALKNPAAVVNLWRKLPTSMRAACPIVFYSRHAHPLPIVFEAVEHQEAILLVRPTRAEIAALYSLADVFVFPSWIEGFGLPILEAMACGAPVVASNRGAIPEVLGDAGLIAGVEQTEVLAAHVKHLLDDTSEILRFRQLGYQRLRAFQWTQSASQMLEVYADVMHRVR